MVKQHLKRLASPKTWGIKKKNITFVIRPNPGPHPLKFQMPITMALRDLLGVVKNTKEAKYVLHNKGCLIDGVNCYDYRRPVGIMDILSLPTKKEFFRVLVNDKNKLVLSAISEEESKSKLVKIRNKTNLKGGKNQLNCTDGRNILVADAKSYKVGDSLRIELPGQKIADHFSFKVGAPIVLLSGAHVGELGTVEAEQDSSVVIKTENGTFTTKKEYAFVLGNDKPVIKVN